MAGGSNLFNSSQTISQGRAAPGATGSSSSSSITFLVNLAIPIGLVEIGNCLLEITSDNNDRGER